MARYRVIQGINYPPNKRAEIGDVVDDLPSSAIKWLVAEGVVELADSISAKKSSAPLEADPIEAEGAEE